MVSLVYPELAEGNHRLNLRHAQGERTDHDAGFYDLVLGLQRLCVILGLRWMPLVLAHSSMARSAFSTNASFDFGVIAMLIPCFLRIKT
jgi:hypothetical protein